MALSVQRDLVTSYKKGTILNVGILSKLQPMPTELSGSVFKENALEKPTQTIFYHLSYYLVCIIDTQSSTSFSWPLYDTKMERAFRNELANFINDHSNKGLLSPVMSSYFVNPGCYKVTKLMFQLSLLAVQKVLLSKMKRHGQKKHYTAMTEKYNSQQQDFLEQIERETDSIMSNFSNYMHKRKAMEKIAEKIRCKISSMEAKLVSSNAQKFLDDLVNGYINKYELDKSKKNEILTVKNVYKQAQYFESWLLEVDQKVDEMESKWKEKVTPLMQTCKESKFCTESLIARHTGEAEKDSYMIEYNHKTDEIDTKDLQNQVNSQQKYILKNIVKDEKLNFPNLVRGFLIAILFILKKAEIGDEIYKFNELFDEGKRNYGEIIEALKELIERVMNTEAKLEPPVTYHRAVSVKDFPEIPPLPDLSDLYCTRDMQRQVFFDRFTPLATSKHQFNLRRKTSMHTFAKPQAKSLFVTPFKQVPKDDFIKSVISCRGSSFDHLNTTQNFSNISMISHCNKVNETVSDCSSGFTKQQISRLLSTRKSSSSKKLKYKTHRPDINIKKGGLFNESNSSNESHRLYKSHSSPNLFENREKRQIPDIKRKKLSMMPEYSPTLLEVSGIAALDKDSNCGTPDSNYLESSRKSDTGTFPQIMVIKSSPDQSFHKKLKDFNIDLNEVISEGPSKKPASKEVQIKTETPRNSSQVISKTSSLEKIINRFKKVRESVLPREDERNSDFECIAEEKENMNVKFNVFTANRILLPDLLSPSCSVISKKSVTYLDDIDCREVEERVHRKPRESLGTALGVDETFLDQFDLID